MVQYCVVPKCKSKAASGVSFYRFPKDDTLRKLWIIKIRRDEKKNVKVSSHMRVCSKHFKPEDIILSKNGKKRKLKSGAVPYFSLQRNTIKSHKKNLSKPDSHAEDSESTLSADSPYGSFVNSPESCGTCSLPMGVNQTHFEKSQFELHTADNWKVPQQTAVPSTMKNRTDQATNKKIDATIGLYSQNIISDKPAKQLSITDPACVPLSIAPPGLLPQGNFMTISYSPLTSSNKLENGDIVNINFCPLAISTGIHISSTPALSQPVTLENTNKVSLMLDNNNSITSSPIVKELIEPVETMDLNQSSQTSNVNKNSPTDTIEKYTQTEITSDQIECLEENNALLLKRILQLEKKLKYV